MRTNIISSLPKRIINVEKKKPIRKKDFVFIPKYKIFLNNFFCECDYKFKQSDGATCDSKRSSNSSGDIAVILDYMRFDNIH